MHKIKYIYNPMFNPFHHITIFFTQSKPYYTTYKEIKTKKSTKLEIYLHTVKRSKLLLYILPYCICKITDKTINLTINTINVFKSKFNTINRIRSKYNVMTNTKNIIIKDIITKNNNTFNYFTNKLLKHVFSNNGYLLIKLGQYLSIYDKYNLEELQNQLKTHTFKETIKLLQEIEDKIDVTYSDTNINYNDMNTGSIMYDTNINHTNVNTKTTTETTKYTTLNNNKNKDRIIITSNNPLFSGSIAQIYKWKYLSNNKIIDIAVKIIHPKILKEIELDMKILKYITNNYIFLNNLNIIPFIKDMSMDIYNQLDLRNEYKNILLFRKLNQIDILESIKEYFNNDKYYNGSDNNYKCRE
ncbi:ABC1 family protein, partial [Spraguea lophii 42_110]